MRPISILVSWPSKFIRGRSTMRVTLFALIIALTIASSAGHLFSASAPGAEQARKLQAVLDAPPPDPKDHSKAALTKLYLERARAAGALGDVDRQLKELSQGIQAIGPKDPSSYELYNQSGTIQGDRGNFVEEREMREGALSVAVSSAGKFFQANFLAQITAVLRDKASAQNYLTMAETLFSSERRSNREWYRIRNLWDAALNNTRGTINSTYGYLAEAEVNYRACATAIRSHLGRTPDVGDGSYYWLPWCLSRAVELSAILGRVREAGAYVNDVRETARAYGQSRNRPLFETRMVRIVARVYLEQGLVDEAKSLLETTMSQVQKAQAGEASVQVADARHLLAMSEMAQENWQRADEIFRARNVGLRTNAEQAYGVGDTSPEWAYTLLRLGRTKEALSMLSGGLKYRQQHFDDQSLWLWEGRAFHALGVGAAGQKEAAVKTLSAALPKILELRLDKSRAGEFGYLSSARMNWILDGYISLLADVHQSGARIEGIEPYAEAFRVADMARGGKVHKALSAAITRASIGDPEAVAVLRRAQDLEHQVKTTAEMLAILQAGGTSADKDKTVVSVQADLVRLREENEKAQAELKRKMPDYSQLLETRSLGIDETQKLLKPQEALISIYSTQKQTLVWAVPSQGQPAFQVVDLPSAKVAELVARLRKTLDPSEADVGQVPTFDFGAAHELYQKLLAPIEAGWKNAKELIIVPHGSLSELPFSVLVKTAYQPNKSGVPFADHAAAPWLIKDVAISYLPSLAALTSLRRSAPQSAERAFIGFGDPMFGSSAGSATALASRGMTRRNAKTPAAPSNPSSNLELLQALPDTAEEVRDIAKILRADENRDVHLGRRASEQSVKTTDLTNYRVVMFATHGLVPGELPGLAQPALALSNPALTGEKEDGLLTLAEILGLKLKADWVVLSACNTASADGQASEAVSGLGRAFFYAGAKALLVSHWPVETVSAKLLTTELFKRQAADTKLSRAQAVREASLAVMQQSSKPDRGQSYSYAHPMFWAPFVIVGDGG
jgi:CHAT domain-containing protein